MDSSPHTPRAGASRARPADATGATDPSPGERDAATGTGHVAGSHLGDGAQTSGTSRRTLARRAVLAAGLAGAGALVWTGADEIRSATRRVADGLSEAADNGVRARPRPQAVGVESLTSYDDLAGARLIYEINGRATRFAIEPSFARQLDASLRSHWQAAGWASPARLTSYGTWIRADGEADSWHHAGRAFDVGRVIAADGRELVSCRYDVWGSRTGAAHDTAAKAYWRLAATLHRDFASVLTYAFDAAHHNHIHVDNGVSGAEQSTFRRWSTNQVQGVQGILRHVWGRPVEISGSWDGATEEAAAAVLAGIAQGDDLGDPTVWRAFLTASARQP